MPIRFRWTLFFIALFSHVALAVTGQMPPQPFILTPITLIGYIRLLMGKPPGKRNLLNIAAAATLIYFLADMTVISGDLLIAVGGLTLAFHAIKSFDIHDPGDGLQVFFMAVIQLVVASELEQPVVFAVIFLLFIGSSILFTMSAHQAAHTPRMPRGMVTHALKLTVIVVPLVLVLFLFLPRTTGGLFGNRDRRQALSGFDESVSIGTFEEVISNTAVVMRITVPEGQQIDPYWRGKPFETYENNAWENHWKRGFPYFNRTGEILLHKEIPENGIEQQVLLIPPKSGIIFALSEVAWIKVDSRFVIQYPNGAIAVSKRQKKRVQYTVVSSGLRPRVRTNSLDLYRQLPSGLERLKELAERITAGASSIDEKCRRISSWLTTNCSYSLRVPDVPPGQHPIEHFLLESRQGYCEYYASAMVLMLRSLDIPARVVAGYHGGDYNRFGDYYVVRQAHAHTWVDAAIGIRWERFDPTPPIPQQRTGLLAAYLDILGFAWDRYVVGFTRDDRDSVFQKISLPFQLGNPESDVPRYIIASLVALILLSLSFRMIWRTFRVPAVHRKLIGPAGRMAIRMMARIRRLSGSGETQSWRNIVRTLPSDVKDPVIRFFRTYERVRFGPPPDHSRNAMDELKTAYRTAVQAVRKARRSGNSH